tara:strand:+ start:865 stop:2169 length:1305 start_codon:yes stop_codon:yes gene_type:complete
MDIQVKATSNFGFLESLPDTTQVVVMEGSTRSGKTIAILQWLILWATQDPGVVIRCLRHDGTTHLDTTVPDFQMVMGSEMFNIWGLGKWNIQKKTYVFPNGSKFIFSATNDQGKLHGMKQDIAWYNEVMEIHYEAKKQIAYRTSTLEIMDFNPSFNHHWVFQKVINEDNLKSGRVAHNRSTYKDNDFLEAKQIFEIEESDPSKPENVRKGTADAYKWAVYGLGERGKVEGAIYKYFELVDSFPEPWQCERHGYGLDFGFSGDPTALTECALFQGNLYLREMIYEKELLVTRNLTKPSIPSIEGHLIELGISADAKIYADCSQPGSIADLVASGFNVIACTKGPDSIMTGINLLKGRKMCVTRGSHNIQVELEHYTWHKKGDGSWTMAPIDKYNHALDGIRYWGMKELQVAKIQERNAGKRKKPTQVRKGLRSMR